MKQLTARDSREIFKVLTRAGTLVNGKPIAVLENRHVLLGSHIYHRLRLDVSGKVITFDVPIDTNAHQMTLDLTVETALAQSEGEAQET